MSVVRTREMLHLEQICQLVQVNASRVSSSTSLTVTPQHYHHGRSDSFRQARQPMDSEGPGLISHQPQSSGSPFVLRLTGRFLYSPSLLERL